MEAWQIAAARSITHDDACALLQFRRTHTYIVMRLLGDEMLIVDRMHNTRHKIDLNNPNSIDQIDAVIGTMLAAHSAL